MCDFHSIVVRKDGAIAHTADNSHSGAIAAFGWRENTDQQTFFVECEWDGIDGEYSLKRVVSLRNGLTLEDLTNKQVRSINRHYKALANVMSGDITAILPGGLLHGVVYWDVYVAARRCAKVSLEDLERIQKELLTVTGGDEATVTGGVGSVLILTHDNKEAKIWQRKMVIVDNDKIRANVPYYLNDAGNFAEL